MQCSNLVSFMDTSSKSNLRDQYEPNAEPNAKPLIGIKDLVNKQWVNRMGKDA